MLPSVTWTESECHRTMQKPHVLQWLALGGRHILQVEQYLRHIDSLISVL